MTSCVLGVTKNRIVLCGYSFLLYPDTIQIPRFPKTGQQYIHFCLSNLLPFQKNPDIGFTFSQNGHPQICRHFPVCENQRCWSPKNTLGCGVTRVFDSPMLTLKTDPMKTRQQTWIDANQNAPCVCTCRVFAGTEGKHYLSNETPGCANYCSVSIYPIQIIEWVFVGLCFLYSGE